jgi:hypothetical protein
MGELFGNGETHDQINFKQTQNPDSVDPGKIETDVSGVFADGTKNDCPIFSVSKDEFYSNMKNDRKRMRFQTEPAAQYLRGTRYNKPFYIQYKDDSTGEHYLRKVK